ncbi:hypothetical protein C8R43DRAFT_997449 [Mycena crocata]|nr:hypothetical protein C8R43DRAFT_997449 [Mycena crocata]
MLFRGIACFSPSVHPSLRSAWIKHGGSLAHDPNDFYRTNVFFCDGPHDPWLKELLSRCLVVRHARWISKSVSEQFLVPVSKYLLDDQFDPRKIEAAPRKPLNPASLARALPPNRSPRREDPQKAAKPNTLKRSLDSENHDDSLSEIDQRPLKRARTQPAGSPTLVYAHSPASLFPNPAARTEFYPSPANSSPLKTPNPKSTPCAAKPAVPLKRIDFTALKLNPAVPLLSFPRLPPRVKSTTFRTDLLPQPAPLLPDVFPDRRRTCIADLLRVPRGEACVFDVSETYRDKVFSCTKITRP